MSATLLNLSQQNRKAELRQVVVNSVGVARSATLRGREYLVAPATLIVPGVLNGSQGGLYYPPEEITGNSRYPVSSWNHMPIVVYHPTLNGVAVSARSQEVLDNQAVGVVLGARAGKGGSLKTELWFDVEDTRRVDERVLNSLQDGQPIELSTGLYVDCEPAPPGALDGKGKPYDFIARNYRPDHLAVLPDQVGACSLEDGCGVFNALVVPSLVLNCRCWEQLPVEGRRSYPKHQVLNVAGKSYGGKKLPASAFAYVPDRSKPSTWKLRIDTPRHVAGAAAALSKGGFRGRKAQIPKSALAAVKSRVRSAWRRFFPDKRGDEMPESIRNRRSSVSSSSSPSSIEWGPLDDGSVSSRGFVPGRSSVPLELTANVDVPDLSLEDIQDRVRCAFREAHPTRYDSSTGYPLDMCYVIAVFPDYVIYVREVRKSSSDMYMSGDVQTYRQSYSIDEAGAVTMDGGEQAVKRVVKYVPVVG